MFGKNKDTKKQAAAATDESESESFRSSIWRMPQSSSSIPAIHVNEQRVHLPELDSQTLPSLSSEAIKSDIGEILTSFQSSKIDSDSSEDLVVKERLIRDDMHKNHGTAAGISHPLKLWRRKLVILIWLNFLMRYRKTFSTFVETLFPVIAFGIICGSLIITNIYTIHYDPSGNASIVSRDDPFHPFNTMEKDRILKYACGNAKFCAKTPENTDNRRSFYYIVYAPNNTFVNVLMAEAKKILNYEDNEKSAIIGVSKPHEVREKVLERWKTRDEDVMYPMGIIFTFGGIPENEMIKIRNNEAIPRKLKYTIRTLFAEITNTAENFPFVDHSAGSRTRHQVSPYIFTGFAGTQLAIDLAFIERAKTEIKKRRRLATTPGDSFVNIDDLVNAYKEAPTLQMFETWMCIVLAMILSFACPNFAVVQELIIEAKQGKVEILKLHGMTPALHWISYLINMSFLEAISSFFLAIIVYYCFAYNSILTYETPGMIWFFLFMYGVAQTADSYFFALFFNSPTNGGMANILRSVATFLIPMTIYDKGYLSRIFNLFLCLIFPQWCLANGIYSYLQLEIYEDGLFWYDFPVLIDTEQYIIVSLPMCCIIFIYSVAIYLLLTIYMDRILSKPFAPGINCLYFWKNCKNVKPENERPSLPIAQEDMTKVFEQPPVDMLCTIRIRNLHKTSEKSYQVPLQNINLDIVEGEILGVIGPAGSGKTTLLHLIAGFTIPTSGYVEMKNLKVHQYSDFLNQFISVCPQKSMLFPTLSVEDHVRLCCMVHGVSYRKSKVQAKMILQLLNLIGLKRHGVLHLSLTQKKKLAMAMALASSPTILILDEPCQGMDIDSSKQFWKYLMSLKSKRTIIISTSRMDDVELYCDRMLLLVNGKPVCYGPPHHIKKSYDIGSVLNVMEGDTPMKKDILEKIVRTEVRGSLKLSSTGYYRKIRRYMLPFGEAYAALIENIEDNAQALQYSKMWISRPELGSLLHKISLDNELETSIIGKENFIAPNISDDKLAAMKMKEFVPHPVEPKRTFRRNFKALFLRKWLSMKQKHKYLVTEFVVPVIFLILTMLYSSNFLRHQPESLPQTLDISMYKDTHTFIRPITADGNPGKWYQAYKNALGDVSTEHLFEDVLPNIEKRNKLTLTNAHQQIVVSFQLDDQHTVGYYSSNAYHSCPIALNTMANAMLNIISQELTAPDNLKPYKILVSNHPIHQYEGFNAGSTQTILIVTYAFILSVIMGLIAAAELRLPIWEQQNGIKRLELMTGVSSNLYWFTNYCGDFIMNLLNVVVMMGVVCIIDLNNRQFVGRTEKNLFALIFFAYLCIASIPYSYFLSLILNPTYNGCTHFLILHFVLGIFPNAITYQVLRNFFTGAPLYIRYIFQIFPQYSVTSALIHYLQIVTERNYCLDDSYKDLCNEYEDAMKNGFKNQKHQERFENQADSNPLFRSCCTAYCERESMCPDQRQILKFDTAIPGLSADLIAMFSQGLFYWIVVLACEKRLLQGVLKFFKTKIFGDKEIKMAAEDTRDTDEPEDVKKEHLKVEYMIDIEDNVDSEIFLVQDVTKFYKDTKAIDHMYFSIPLFKTTAIMGLAKSGMTTVIKLITGQMRTSSGYIYMDNENVGNKFKTSMTEKIGYMPQQSCYYPHLTGFQMLQLFGKLRGIPDGKLDIHVNRWISIFDLQSDAKRTCKNYRPGVLRRLCCAMALIGKTRVVIFDQPTTEMDLRERHTFWAAVKQIRNFGQTIIFTSSFAEEVQQVANKVMILNQGAFVAIGTTDEVFKTNARGFTLCVRCRLHAFKNLNAYQISAKMDQLKDHIIRHLSPCELLFDEENVVIYQLKDLTMKLSYAYGIMEGARENFPNLLDNFIIAEQSLEDVLLNFQKSKKTKRNSGSEDVEHIDGQAGHDSR